MTMKKKLAIALCSMPFVLAPVAFAQTGGATEGTTSPQSGNQTDMGTDGASNTNGASGSGSSNTDASTTTPSTSSGSSADTTGGDASTGASTSGDAASGASSSSGAASTTTEPTPDAASGESFDAKLKGKSVYNENDEKVGDVKDLVMSDDGKVTHVILGVGGFVGVGEHPVAIPFDEINTSGDKLTLQGYTKDQLKEMPAYEYPKDERAPASAPAPGGATGASPMGPR